MKRTRITYKMLCGAIDEWNRKSGFGTRQRGYLGLANDAGVHWLTQISADGTAACDTLSGTDGTIRSCWERLLALPPGAIEIPRRPGLEKRGRRRLAAEALAAAAILQVKRWDAEAEAEKALTTDPGNPVELHLEEVIKLHAAGLGETAALTAQKRRALIAAFETALKDEGH